MRLFGWLRPKPVEVEPEDEYIVPNTVMVMPVNRRTRRRVDPRHGTEVLIVDDSAESRAKLSGFLKQVNCLVLEAPDSLSALQIARDERPHLVFVEAMLPGTNGYSFLRKLRREPELENIPVIVMSADPKAAEYYFGRHSDADDFMKKPFARQEVFARVERLLDVHRVPRRIKPSEIMDDSDSVDTQDEA